MTERTNIRELAEFFPASGSGCTPVSRSNKVRVIPWQVGETYEEALARHEAKAVRIEAQIAARKSSAADTL
jgi:hypothetical protein